MKYNVLTYLIGEGISNIFKNKKQAATSFGTMCVIMIFFGICFILVGNFNNFIKQVEAEQGIQAYITNEATDEERNEYLINEVNKCNSREAQVVCELVYYDGNGYIVGEGILDGFISTTRRGNNGFGFDEIFELPNGLTLAEVTPLEKNQVSARALAAKDLQKKLGARFGTR